MRKSFSLMLVLLVSALFTARAAAPSNGLTCYLYNVGQQKWLSAADDGTLTLGGARLAVTLATVAQESGAADASYYTLTTARGKICSALLSVPRCDGSVPYDQWRFDEVAGKPGVYTLANRHREGNTNSYMYYSMILGSLFTEPLKPWTLFAGAQWQIYTEEEIPTEDIYLSETTESYTVPTVQDGSVAKVHLNRALTMGEYNSFCVPFDIPRSQLVEQFGDDVHVIHLDSYDGTTVNFVTYTGDIVAGEPYHVKPSKAGTDTYNSTTNYVFTGVTNFIDAPHTAEAVSADGSRLTYYATFFKTTAPQGSYVIRNGDIYHLVSDMAIKGFRGYIVLEGTDKASVAGYTIDATPSGINGIEDFGSGTRTSGVYNTAGQKMSDGETNVLPKGVYVINGKKVIK